MGALCFQCCIPWRVTPPPGFRDDLVNFDRARALGRCTQQGDVWTLPPGTALHYVVQMNQRALSLALTDDMEPGYVFPIQLSAAQMELVLARTEEYAASRQGTRDQKQV